MKRIQYLLVVMILLAAFIFIGCASAPAPGSGTKTGGTKAAMPDPEAALRAYDFSVLAKIEEKKLPRYVAAIVGDATELKEAKIDLGELMQDAINKSGRLTLVDRKSLDKIMQEQKLSLTGMFEEGDVRIGELAGADYLVLSNIISSSQQKVDKVVYDMMEVKVVVQIKLVNVNSGEIFVSVKGEGKSETKLVTDSDGNLVSGAVDFNNMYASAVLSAVETLVPEFINKFPAIGFIVKMEGEVLTCDLGSQNGIKQGAYFAVIRPKGATKHPVTEKIIGYEYDYLGYGTATEISGTTSKITVKEAVGEIKAADLVVSIQ
ncbi:MAG: hypothetical protein E4H36_02735 [Spirochaetales bacterium]|nr:MAG: hypothetical protein E4H36_02735 [Spirochaetales bacterium]